MFDEEPVVIDKDSPTSDERQRSLSKDELNSLQQLLKVLANHTDNPEIQVEIASLISHIEKQDKSYPVVFNRTLQLLSLFLPRLQAHTSQQINH